MEENKSDKVSSKTQTANTLDKLIQTSTAASKLLDQINKLDQFAKTSVPSLDLTKTALGSYDWLGKSVGTPKFLDHFAKTSVPSLDLTKTALGSCDWLGKSVGTPKFLDQFAKTSVPSLDLTKTALGSYDWLGSTSNSASKLIEQINKFNAFFQSDALGASAANKGLAGVYSIGSTLNFSNSFAAVTSNNLRLRIGDWTRPLDFNESDLLKVGSRNEFYAARGYDPNIAAIPRAEFYRATLETGVRNAPFDFQDFWEEGLSVSKMELERTNAAHMGIFLLERRVRKFISTKMTKLFGAHWYKQRVPGDMLKKWEEKRSKNSAGTDPSDLDIIEFADFTDYLIIICQKNNWREAFSDIFERETDIRESFQRLFPVRLSVMHSRPITQDDEFLLMVEAKRLLSAIARS